MKTKKEIRDQIAEYLKTEAIVKGGLASIRLVARVFNDPTIIEQLDAYEDLIEQPRKALEWVLDEKKDQ